MCGRYAAKSDSTVILREFAVENEPRETLAADFNVAPTKKVYVVLDRADRDASEQAGPERRLTVARWGLVPSRAKDPSIARG